MCGCSHYHGFRGHGKDAAAPGWPFSLTGADLTRFGFLTVAARATPVSRSGDSSPAWLPHGRLVSLQGLDADWPPSSKPLTGGWRVLDMAQGTCLLSQPKAARQPSPASLCTTPTGPVIAVSRLAIHLRGPSCISRTQYRDYWCYFI